MANQIKRIGGGSGGGSSSVKSAVANVASLPLTGNTINDLRFVISENNFYRWDGSSWIAQTTNASKYSLSFNATSSWTLDGSEYVISISQATHNKGTNPLVEVTELVSGELVGVIVSFNINNSGDIKIQVPSNPDLRFEGKLTII
jgi:hypothetical protein